jgi:hypothetical protein
VGTRLQNKEVRQHLKTEHTGWLTKGGHTPGLCFDSQKWYVFDLNSDLYSYDDEPKYKEDPESLLTSDYETNRDNYGKPSYVKVSCFSK